MAIRANWTNWPSGQNGPTGHQGKIDQLAIRAKSTNWSSENNGPTGHQRTVVQQEISTKEAIKNELIHYQFNHCFRIDQLCAHLSYSDLSLNCLVLNQFRNNSGKVGNYFSFKNVN